MLPDQLPWTSSICLSFSDHSSWRNVRIIWRAWKNVWILPRINKMKISEGRIQLCVVCLFVYFISPEDFNRQPNSPHFVVIFLLLFVVFSLPRHGKCLIYLCLPSNWDSYWHIVGGQGFFLNSKWSSHEDRATLTELIKSINSIYSTCYSWKVFMDISFKVPMQSSGWEVLDFISNLGHNSNWRLK